MIAPILAVCAMTLLVSLSLELGAQTRTAPKPSRTTRPPLPFAEFIKSYDETPYVTRAVFKNGLTVLVHEFRVAPVAAVITWVKSGSMDEPSGKSGVSRLLAQMLYKGTATRGTGVIGKDLRALGGESAMLPYLQRSYREILPAIFRI